MGLRHRSLGVEGVQFHPESVLTASGPDLLANFLAQLGTLAPLTRRAQLTQRRRWEVKAPGPADGGAVNDRPWAPDP